jgi:CO/xanthine dehydrogenase FAD-binding subunit
MKPPPFAYHDPTTLDEATELLGRLDNALPLAGGQSLMPMLNFRVVAPDHLIDLNRIESLSYIAIADNAGHFGAMTRQRDLEFSPDVARAFPIVHEALKHVGHRQTRNRGTFGGSLCHLDPSAELVNVVALHDGVLEAASSGKRRTIKIADWANGAMTNSLSDGELLTAIELRAWPRATATPSRSSRVAMATLPSRLSAVCSRSTATARSAGRPCACPGWDRPRCGSGRPRVCWSESAPHTRFFARRRWPLRRLKP